MLRKFEFEERHLSLVQDFRCGEEVWEQEVADWVRKSPGESGALDAIRDGRCQVWLYENDESVTVGYGSLGTATWKELKKKHAASFTLWTIPSFGVRLEFHGKPEGVPPEDRYASLIFSDLLAEARDGNEGCELIGLHVHTENSRAIRFYQRFGFATYGLPNSAGYQRMARRVDSAA